MASVEDTFWTGTLFLSDEHVATGAISWPDAPAYASLSASPGAGAVFPVSRLVDLCGELNLFDDPAPDVRAADSLTELFGELSLVDAATTDDFPSDVVVIDDSLPPVASDPAAGVLDVSIFVEVMATDGSHRSGAAAWDPLEATIHALANPVCADAGHEELEEFCVKLFNNATKMAALKRHAEAPQPEIDRVVGDTPAMAKLAAPAPSGNAVLQ